MILPLLTDFPTLKLRDLLGAPSPSVSMDNVKVGSKGACLRMHLLGKCSVQGCSFNHKAITIPPERVTAIAAHLLRAGKAFRIHHK